MTQEAPERLPVLLGPCGVPSAVRVQGSRQGEAERFAGLVVGGDVAYQAAGGQTEAGGAVEVEAVEVSSDDVEAEGAFEGVDPAGGAGQGAPDGGRDVGVGRGRGAEGLGGVVHDVEQDGVRAGGKRWR